MWIYSSSGNSSSPKTLFCFIYRRMLLSQVMKYYLFISSKADIGWSMGSNLIQYYCHQVESPRQLLHNTESRQTPGAGSISKLILANTSAICSCAVKGQVGLCFQKARHLAPGTWQWVHNQRARVFSGKPAQRKSKHVGSAGLQVASTIYWLPIALARAYRRVHSREE